MTEFIAAPRRSGDWLVRSRGLRSGGQSSLVDALVPPGVNPPDDQQDAAACWTLCSWAEDGSGEERTKMVARSVTVGEAVRPSWLEECHTIWVYERSVLYAQDLLELFDEHVEHDGGESSGLCRVFFDPAAELLKQVGDAAGGKLPAHIARLARVALPADSLPLLGIGTPVPAVVPC